MFVGQNNTILAESSSIETFMLLSVALDMQFLGCAVGTNPPVKSNRTNMSLYHSHNQPAGKAARSSQLPQNNNQL